MCGGVSGASVAAAAAAACSSSVFVARIAHAARLCDVVNDGNQRTPIHSLKQRNVKRLAHVAASQQRQCDGWRIKRDVTAPVVVAVVVWRGCVKRREGVTR